MLGSEYFVHFDFDEGLDLIAKVTSTEKIVAGDKMNIEVSENALHLFEQLLKKLLIKMIFSNVSLESNNY